MGMTGGTVGVTENRLQSLENMAGTSLGVGTCHQSCCQSSKKLGVHQKVRVLTESPAQTDQAKLCDR